jgi:Domain of unknown function (DUF4258)
MTTSEIQALVRAAAAKRILYLPHTLQQITKPERMIRPDEIRSVVERGEIIEDYPNDARGHSCLMLGFALDGRPIHVVCAPKNEYLAIITAYLPNPQQWSSSFRERLSL